MIAPVAAIVGVVLGGGLSARRERRQWLTQQRFAAYTNLNSSARRMLWRGGEVGLIADGSTLPAQIDRVRAAMFDVRESAALVELVGAAPVVAQAQRLRSMFGDELFDYLTSLDGPQDESHPAILNARQQLKAFQEATRNHL
jgi:hypothetical protein